MIPNEGLEAFSGVSETFVDVPTILVGVPETFVDVPAIFVGVPETFVGVPTIFVGVPETFVGAPAVLFSLFLKYFRRSAVSSTHMRAVSAKMLLVAVVQNP